MLLFAATSFAYIGGFLMLMIVAAAVIVPLSLIRGLAEWMQNNKAPVETVSAVIVRMREQDDTTVMTNADGSTSVMGGTVYYVTFRTEQGAEREFHVSRREYRSFREGMRGMLTFQGTRWHGFQPM